MPVRVMIAGMVAGCVLAAGLGASARAQMQSVGPLDRPAISRTADSLFRQICVERFGDPAGMERALQERGFNLAPTEAVARLPVGEPGRVWRWNDVKQPLLVVTRDTGVQCQLMAPFADVEESAAQFRRTVAGLRQRGAEVTVERDEPAQLGGQPGRQVFFRIRPASGGGNSRLLALSVALPRYGGVSLMMTASLLPPGGTGAGR